MHSDFIQALIAIVGDSFLFQNHNISIAYTQDWDKTCNGKPDALVIPKTTEQVAAILQLCNTHGIAVIPQGGHTGRSGGATPIAVAINYNGQIVLSMERFNAIRSVDTSSKTMTVESGCILANIQEAADDAGFYFPLTLGAKGSCQIGGNLATNAGGLNVLRYGSARQLCLGVEAVLANGEIMSDLSPLHKNNSGYDLSQLLIGSEGTLAIITAATIKLFDKPTPCLTAWIEPASVNAATKVLQRLQKASDNAVSGFELIPAALLTLLQQYRQDYSQPMLPIRLWNVLLEVNGNESLATLLHQILEDCINDELIKDAVIVQNEKTRQYFWHLREIFPMIQSEHGQWIKGDVALPISAVNDYIEQLEKIILQKCGSGLYVIGFGHLGDGNLHVSLRPNDNNPNDDADCLFLYKQIHDLAVSLGGTFSAEHGIGKYKVDMMEKYKEGTNYTMMKKIKSSFDPNHILNPSCLFK